MSVISSSILSSNCYSWNFMLRSLIVRQESLRWGWEGGRKGRVAG
jgi:hypothetical protein